MKKVICMILCLCMCFGMVGMLSGCKNKQAVDAFVIQTEQLDGLFNPFFSTSATDGTIVAMTQIGMLSSKYVDGKTEVAYGENEAVVTLDYEIVDNGDNTTSYYFVLKNGIKFSDGHPLTMEDVLFNYYVYLDPVYTGSNTLYSTKIQGLQQYRTQTQGSGNQNGDTQIANQAANRATMRVNELASLYASLKDKSSTGEVSESELKAAINSHKLSNGYKTAIAVKGEGVDNSYLLADYEEIVRLYKEELNTDYTSAQESFKDEPYKNHPEFQDEVFCFMFYEGYVQVEYPLDADGKKDKTKIESMTKKYPETITTKEAAIDYCFKDTMATKLDMVLLYTASGNTLQTDFQAKAKEVILAEKAGTSGDLAIPNISGIVSLGHTEAAGTKQMVNGTEYTVASGHNADGTVTNTAEHDILKITIDGVDPKAIWNFALTVAPQHYYGQGSKVPVDIANNKFGVEYASFDFMQKIVQSPRNIKLPMGAGAYKVTNASNSDTPSESDFYINNVVYFKANNYFETVGAGINNAKIEKIRYQVVTSSNAIDALKNGQVHYISPSLTKENFDRLTGMANEGTKMLTSQQLGYGYVGINASKVQNINLRKAIMCAMNTSLAIDYYRTGTAEQIYWNMSKVSWAYPDGASANDNGKDYPQMGKWDRNAAVDNVKKYMKAAGVSAGDSQLKMTFTIAGSNLTDHPTYKVFRDAAELLNEQGWDVEVKCDTQALTKINTGALTVWAAAWSSALDPDMYQVYHKDSSATSTLAWGYNHLNKSGTAEERKILTELSKLIDDARSTNDQDMRCDLYEEAMGYVLDLAVELPVYQRSVLYAYNSNVIKSSSLPSEINPYSSPLDRIWEIEFVN